MATNFSNVFFMCAARMAGQGIIVASYSYNTETELGAVKQVLEQPNMTMAPGKHYSFNVGQLAWHLISDDMGLIYVMICQVAYPQRCAHMGLEELQRSFVAKVGDKAVTAKDRSLDKQCSSMLLKLDKLASLERKVDTVKLVMQENVDAALQNCVKLESIEKAAEELQQQAGVFKRNANELKNKMWWKNMKMRLIIAAVIIVILGVIAAIIAVMTQGKKGDSS
eukprot:CAMPEP_0181346076 /NCGR_PEP_ID=MMETSP1101-20121128/33121_1 /TAXON_ID=46948 /ORGANISM="Rhodomonas abbreviata, Strain Caron Lab Isolate" /LENGTH=222 /DNA_ID=CAMNT_0023458137 /DNA_START=38 /DNA_END=706 /DNA_ORIENTATION=-